MVDVDPVRRRRGKFVPVERGVGLRDDRPRVRVGGRFAGEVAGVEFLEGGVDVVEVERDDVPRSARRRRSRRRRAPRRRTRRAERRGSKARTRARARRSPRVAMTVDVMVSDADARRWLACPRCAASRPCRTPAFTTRRRSSWTMSSASSSAMASQSRAAKYAWKRSIYSACRVFQPRRLRLQFVEPRERGVEVCLVEELAAVDQVAVDGQKRRSSATRRRSPPARSHAPHG